MQHSVEQQEILRQRADQSRPRLASETDEAIAVGWLSSQRNGMSEIRDRKNI